MSITHLARRRWTSIFQNRLQSKSKNSRQSAFQCLSLEDRLVPAPIPAITGLGNSQLLLGSPANFSFTFANAHPTDDGYGPFIELAVDTTGPDGSSSLPFDGYGTPSVSVAGLPLSVVGSPIQLTPAIISAGVYTNPLTNESRPVPTGFNVGDTIYIYALPFGSFTPGQFTQGQISIPTSSLADINSPLPIALTGGFRDDHPSLTGPAFYGSTQTASVTPQLYTLNKTYLGPEDETATGANYVRRYRLDIDIATGQTLTNLQVQDILANSMQIVGLNPPNMFASTSAGGLGTNIFNPANLGGSATPGTPGGNLLYTFGTVVGVPGIDARFEFDFYIPRDNTAAAATVPQGTNSTLATNTSNASANWTPLDPRDPTQLNIGPAASLSNFTHTLEQQSLAVQKSVTQVTIAAPNTPATGPLQPGQSLLRYVIDFQVSDYFALDNVNLQDLLGDGQRLYLGASGNDPTFQPTLQVNNAFIYNPITGVGTRQNVSAAGFSSPGSIDYRQLYTNSPNANPIGYPINGPQSVNSVFTNLSPISLPLTNDYVGSTYLNFKISQELIHRLGPNAGRLVGGDIANSGSPPNNHLPGSTLHGATTGRIVFWAIVTQEYSDIFQIAAGGSGDPSIDQGDLLTNQNPVDHSADALAANGGQPFRGVNADQINTTQINQDNPEQLDTISGDNTGASINVPRGDLLKQVFAINGTLIDPQTAAETVFSVQAGDLITFKLTYTLPISRFEELQILDIPPLPVLPVGPIGPYTFQRVTDGIYIPYQIEVATDDTFFSTFPAFPNLVPGSTIVTDANTNTLTMLFGNFEDNLSRATTISLLVTLPVIDVPFANDLFLSNQLRVNEGSTVQGTTTVEDLRRFQLVRPQVTINKGAVGSNSTGLSAGGIAFAPPSNPAGTFTIGGNPLSPTNALDTASEASIIGGLTVTRTNSPTDAGDTVRYAIVAQNVGRGDAFNVQIRDVIPADFIRPPTIAGLNLRLIRGDGSAMDGTSITNTATFIDGVDYSVTYNPSTGEFLITLKDNYTAGNVNNPGQSPDSRPGGISRGQSSPVIFDGSGSDIPITNGSNTVIALYDVVAAGTVTPNQTITNTAAVTVYSSSETGPDLTDPNVLPGATDPTDDATVQIKLPLQQKTLVATEIDVPGNNNISPAPAQATIGELITYTLTITIPEGTTPSANILDNLTAGLQFFDITDVQVSNGITTTTGLSFAGNGAVNAGIQSANLTLTSNGRVIQFNLGTITNSNTVNSTAETITITYRVVVRNTNQPINNSMNVNENQAGANRSNSARFRWADNATTLSTIQAGQSTTTNGAATGTATQVRIVEPSLTVVKDVAVDDGATGTYTAFAQQLRADAGDNIRYRLTIANPFTNSTRAFDVTLSDPLPVAAFSGGVSAFSIVSVNRTDSNPTRQVFRNGSPHTLTPSDFVISGTGELTLNPGFAYDVDAGVTIELIVQGNNFLGTTGALLTNTADLRWTSMPGSNPNERTGADGPGPDTTVLNNYASIDDAVLVSPPLVHKSIIATSEAWTVPASIAAPGVLSADVAIGEIVRYRIYVSIPETGTGNEILNAQIQDFIPSGSIFLNDGSARYVFIADAPNPFATTAAAGGTIPAVSTTAFVIGSSAELLSLPSSSVTGVFADANISQVRVGAGTGEGTYADGQDVFFRIGNIANTNNDVNLEFIVIEYNVLVLNVAGNQSSPVTNLSNSFAVLVDLDGVNGPGYISVVRDGSAGGTNVPDGVYGTGDTVANANDPNNNATGTPGTSNSTTVTVVEPNVTIEKTVRNLTTGVPASGFVESVSADAGDILEFQIVLGNNGNADAFNIELSDVLPTGLQVTSVTQTGGPALTTLQMVGNAVIATFAGTEADGFDPGETITLTFQAVVLQAVAPNATITNNATVTWTGLPGTNGTASNPTGSNTPGTPGTATGERTGPTGPGDTLNNYTATDPASLTVPGASLVKSLFATNVSQTSGNNVTVGETVTYALRITLPESTVAAGNLVLTDLLPPGLQFTGTFSLVTTAVASNGLLSSDFGGSVLLPGVSGGPFGSGIDPVFTFSQITTNGDNDATNNSFLLLLDAIVLNIPANEGILPTQTSLDNQGQMQLPGQPVSTTPPVTMTVVEPQLQTTKSVVGDSSVDANAVITYQVTISHTANSTGPAFDLNISDLLHPGLTLVVGSVTTSSGTVTTGNTSGDTSIAITVPVLLVGDTITITYQATVDGPPTAGAVAPGGSIMNTVRVNYDTFPGPNPEQREEPEVSNNATITINTYTVGGVIWSDQNNNGVYEPGLGETLITGQPITIQLTGTDHLNNPVSLTQVTTTGTYSVTGLRPGTYSVIQVNQPVGYLDGIDARNSNGFSGSNFGGTGTSASDPRGTPTVPGRDAETIAGIVIPLNAEQNGVANVGGSYNFGEILPATLGDTVWEDLNGNGVLNGGEPGIPGVQVTLTGTDDTGSPVNVTTVTGAGGVYSFGNLRPGIYTVAFSNSDGTTTYAYTRQYSPLGTPSTDSNGNELTGITDPIVLGVGEVNTTIDQGLYVPIIVGDRVWYDVNANGLQDSGEPGIVGVIVTLTGTDGSGRPVSRTTTTGLNGLYLFDDLPPGTYTVSVPSQVLPNGFSWAANTTPTTQNTTAATQTSGGEDLARDFGFRGAGSLGDRVWLDTNSDGIQDTNGLEPGIPGLPVTLAWAGQDGIFGTADDVNFIGLIPDVTTGLNGVYNFTDLPTGLFRVTVDPTAGGIGSNLVNTYDLVNGTVNPQNTAEVELTDLTPIRTDVDFGYIGNASVGNRVWIDRNRDGVQDPTEPSLTGAVIELVSSGVDGILGTADDMVLTLTTVADLAETGNYLFTGLPVFEGTSVYSATVTSVPGPLASVVMTYNLNDGAIPLVSQTVNPGAGTEVDFIVTDAGVHQNRRDVDWGFGGLSAISGTVYRDDNNNGVQDLQFLEPGIPGVELILTGVDLFGNPVLDPNTGQPYRTVTAPDGTYIFSNLVPGTYTVTQLQPPQYNDGIDTAGSLGGDDASVNDVISDIVIGVGDFATDYNFGELGSFVSGTVFRDTDRDGLLNPNDPGIAGIVVELRDATGTTVLATTVTNQIGFYIFPNIPAGDYQIVQTQPVGYANTPTGPFQDNIRSVTVPLTGLTEQNFGEVLGGISGTVYLDLNNDGRQQIGEPGLSGVIVTLTGTDAAGAAVVKTAITNAAGEYQFTDLLAGNYTVTQTQPLQYPDGRDGENHPAGIAGTLGGVIGNDVLSGINLPAGEFGNSYNFGELAPLGIPPGPNKPGATSLSGVVWLDLNRDGSIDSNEVGIAGVTITLTGPNGINQTTTTGPDGSYLFTNLPPGNYTITQTQPTIYGSTTPNVVTATIPTSLVPVTNVNFGESPGTLSGSVYFDADDDGVRDSDEPGIAGVIVILTGTDLAGNPITQVTTTDLNGYYQFTGLPAGTYNIVQSQPLGWIDGQDSIGSLGGNDSVNDQFTNIILPPGESGVDYLFGEINPSMEGTTFVSGTVWLDSDRDSVLDFGESGIAGVTVELYQANGTLVATTTTGPDGSYVFLNVPPGSYRVQQVQPNQYGSSTPNIIPVFVPPSLVPVTSLDFGEVPASLSGWVYLDANDNGIRDDGERGIGGVVLSLTGEDINGNPISLTTTTDSSGFYIFNDLPASGPEGYTISQSQPIGYADGLDGANNPENIAGSLGGIIGNDLLSAILVEAGEIGDSYNFGEIGVNSLSGFVYLDYNLNGVFNPSGPDVPFGGGSITLNNGVMTGQPAITLTTPPFQIVLAGVDAQGNQLTFSTITAADGSYSFTGLPAGSYTIIQSVPVEPILVNNTVVSGLYNGLDTVGTINGIQTGTNPAANQLAVPLTGDGSLANPAQNGIGYNFGELPPADPFGFVYVDENANGVRDPGEPGIPNVPITISGTAFAGTPFARPLLPSDIPGGSLTIFTDANGRWEFLPIPPGLYSIVQSAQPAGFLDGVEQNADPNGQSGGPVIVGNDVFSNILVEPFPIRGPFNFGELRPSSIAGVVYHDVNRNGVRDPGEPGIPGVAITLTGTVASLPGINPNLHGSGVGPITITTDANGNFLFSGLLPGIYALAEAQPIPFAQGNNAVGSSGGLFLGTDIIGLINLGPGVNAVNYLFGEVNPTGSTPEPVPPLGPLPPVTSIAPGAVSKRAFLASTPFSDHTERVVPDFAALGSLGAAGANQFLSTADGVGGELVRVFDLTRGVERFRLRPFPGNPGGTRVSTGDVTNDGVPDVVAVPGPGGGPRVVVYDGNNAAVLFNQFAFEESFTGGLFVVTGDLNGDGYADIVVSADVGGGPRVKVYDGRTGGVLADFWGIDDPNFRGGARVALGDVNGDGQLDLIVAAGVGGGPRVAIFDGASVVAGNPNRLIPDFYAFESTLVNGVYITAADINGDGFADLAFGAGPGGAPRVTGFDGSSLIAGQLVPLFNFFVGDLQSRGGIPVHLQDIDNDGTAELITGTAAGEPSLVRFVDLNPVNELDAFYANWKDFLGGVYVG